MSAIITADTHWNDNPRDESRWGLLDWLANDVQADELILLGDLTVAKNNHPARMVNRLVEKFLILSLKYKQIYILKGNHDYTDPNCPFFMFLEHTKRNIYFLTEPTLMDNMSIGSWLFMPAGTDWQENQGLLHKRNVFAHVTFDGAISETGYQLTGVSPHLVRDAQAKVIAGDIHKRQTLMNGAIEYVGAPYHIRFGDDFNPRLMLIQNDESRTNLHYPSPRKFTQVIDSLADLYRIKIKAGDQIKIIANLRRADLPEWKNWRDAIKEQAEKEGWILFGPELKLKQDAILEKNKTTTRQSNETLIEEYATRQKASQRHLDIGQELLKASKS